MPLFRNVRSNGVEPAQVKTGSTVHFPITKFLNDNGWHSSEAGDRWQCVYTHSDHESSIEVHSKSGEGDVVASLTDGKTLRVESKKGPLRGSRSSQEYPLIREAIGQLMTIEDAAPSDVLAVAVPQSEKFMALAAEWRNRPLIKSVGIRIITVSRNNEVFGL